MGFFDLITRNRLSDASSGSPPGGPNPQTQPKELELDQILRNKVALRLRKAIGPYDHRATPDRNDAARLWLELQELLQHAKGILGFPNHEWPDEAVLNWFLRAPDADALAFIELAFAHARRDFAARAGSYPPIFEKYVVDRRTGMDLAIEDLNRVFRQHELPLEFRGDKLIRIDSTHLHAEAVAPALLGLADKRFATAEAEFASAFEHQRHGRFPEAITDATKALESTLKITLDIKKVPYAANATLKQLVDAVFGAKLLPDYLPETLTGLRTLLANAGSIRNKTSAHGQGATPKPVDNALCSLALSQTAALIRFMLDVCIKPTR